MLRGTQYVSGNVPLEYWGGLMPAFLAEFVGPGDGTTVLATAIEPRAATKAFRVVCLL
jgi:hypothetical protein